ncbi:hypothetical protein [Nocardiopsis sp. NRRL B-16309]|uniref:Gp37-like protein n=1 Tax=Nocardiopsis sp. NRRL B-16309 TaxID=1519494 RepID=UPI0006AD96CA|nr:hypothetical protein [Nocardiopsis sp. NRRL B-16309]KOX12497.1 hypothetical protein ADL05_21745 [Nocardiopsis sp. NRRL B-16309]
MDADTDSAAALLQEGNGIVFDINGRTVFSGPTITSAERFTDLHEHTFSLGADANLGWRVLQNGTVLEFGMHEPRGLTQEMGFSVELGNLDTYTYELTPPEVTHLVIGAGGDPPDHRPARAVRKGAVAAPHPSGARAWSESVPRTGRRPCGDGAEPTRSGPVPPL